MTVPRQLLLFLGLLGIWLTAGCRGGSGDSAIAETDEPEYRRGQQLVKQTRPQEALASFLKVIVKRGEQLSPESHLEAGLLYLTHSKNPIRASYHFEEYLAQQGPNSPQAARVRGLMETAKKEYARTLPGPSLENQTMRAEYLEQIEKLQRKVRDLEAEMSAMRSGASTPVLKAVRAPANGEPPSTAPMRINVPAPVPVTTAEDPSPITPAPMQSRSAVTDAPPPTVPANNSRPNSPGVRPAPARPGAQTPIPTAPTTIRRHVVEKGETLYAIERKYYGAPSAAKTKEILEANRDVMKNEGDLKPGMTLRIPQ